MRLDRSTTPHQVFEAELEVLLEGAFDDAYIEGDNSGVLPTDSMRNTIYAAAREQEFTTGEEFALHLARYFADRDGATRATVQLEERPWRRLDDHDSAFFMDGAQRRTVRISVEGSQAPVITAGLRGLEILKSARSGFAGFPRDRYTTLKETDDRILRTRLAATWEYASEDADFSAVRDRVRGALLDAFAEHESRSVQHTLHFMAQGALDAAPEIERVTLQMPNLHCLLMDLERFDLENRNCVFVPVEEPSGVIEATVERAA